MVREQAFLEYVISLKMMLIMKKLDQPTSGPYFLNSVAYDDAATRKEVKRARPLGEALSLRP